WWPRVEPKRERRSGRALVGPSKTPQFARSRIASSLTWGWRDGGLCAQAGPRSMKEGRGWEASVLLLHRNDRTRSRRRINGRGIGSTQFGVGKFGRGARSEERRVGK